MVKLVVGVVDSVEERDVVNEVVGEVIWQSANDPSITESMA